MKSRVVKSRATYAFAGVAVLLFVLLLGPGAPAHAKPNKDKDKSGGTTTTVQAPASCTPPGPSVSCTIRVIVTPRTVTVRLLNQDVIINTPAITQTVVTTVTQAGPVVGQVMTDCSAQVTLSGGNANVSVTVDGQPLASSNVVIPAAGEVAFIDVCPAPSEP